MYNLSVWLFMRFNLIFFEQKVYIYVTGSAKTLHVCVQILS